MFNINDISKYRSELMGFAILWIMTYHFSFFQIPFLDSITQFGYAGVEIFMLVSGYGLYCSLENDNNLVYFYKKRFFRIFPIYYLVGIVDSIIVFHDNLLEYFFRYSTIGFWINSYYADWYIPTIICLYLIAPFIKQLYDNNKKYLCILVALLLIFIAFTFADTIDRAHFFTIYRVPAFIFGMFCAYWVKYNMSSIFYYITTIIGLPIFFYLYTHYPVVYNFRFFSFLFLMPSIVISLILFIRYTNIKFFSHTLSEMGKASLEIYLVQGIFYHLVIFKIICFPNKYHDVLSMGYIIVSTLIGCYIHHVWKKSYFHLNKLKNIYK